MKTLSKKMKIAVVCTAAVFLLVIGGVVSYQFGLKAVSSQSEIVEFKVEQGDSMNSVIQRLKQEQVIKNQTMAKIYVKLHSINEVKAGDFKLDKSWTTPEILAYLGVSENAKAQEITITFQENLWAKDIAKKLSEQFPISEETFLSLWNDTEFLNELISEYEFLTEDILKDEYRVKLEGYLFPETYSFKKDATAEEITRTFLDHFDVIYQKHRDEFENSERSIHENVILASMVQFEASKEEDMYLVAGVFQNRLDIDMTLGSSVTVCYALYDDFDSPESCELQYDIDSPYNTNLYTGLPIGPVINPGETAILAALHPQETEYLYFCADIYGDGTVYFSKTLEEHEAMMKKLNLFL